MPELPEVEVTRRRITPHIQGKTIFHVTVRNPDLRLPIPSEIGTEIPGRIIQAVERRGKYLLFDCTAGWIILHLGMTGEVKIVPVLMTPDKHDHLDIVLRDGQCLRFNDTRRFGTILWTENDPLDHPLLKGLGPEPLTDAFTGQYIFRRSRGRSIGVKQFIMDGKVVAGLGNIYATEALYEAGIHPEREAGRISLVRYRRLVDAIKTVLLAAIEEGMSAANQLHFNTDATGYFPVSLHVYGRAGEPCSRCGAAIRQFRQAGRSSWICPECQR
jgi:formamidopyrimidine-DNA glycosylase